MDKLIIGERKCRVDCKVAQWMHFVLPGRGAARLIEMAAHAGTLAQESCHETLRGSAWAVMGSVGLCAQAHGMQECLPAFPSLATVGSAHITNKNSNSNSNLNLDWPLQSD